MGCQPITAFTTVEKNRANSYKNQRQSKYIENTYIVLLYIKISHQVERIDNFRALVRKLSFLSTVLDSFDIRQHYVRILFFIIFFSTSDFFEFNYF